MLSTTHTRTMLLQGLLCGVLQVIVQKLSEQENTKAGILQFADQIMEVLLQVILRTCLWRHSVRSFCVWG